MKAMSVRSGLLLGAAFASAAWSGAARAQNAPETIGLEEIIVTAQKREQSVQDVPIAVTAVTQETLRANRIYTVNDLGSIAPGVTVRPSAGGNQVPSFTIRGQNSFGVVAGSDKQVSIYLDGVYISSPRGSIFDLPDIARLEVLRGPQGTLFGRNATAGAISVITRDPTGEVHFKGSATVGNYGHYRVRASLDLPQVGPFSGYLSFMRNYKRGEIRNAGAGTVWDRSLSPDKHFGGVAKSPKFLGTQDSNSYFGALKFEPSDTFSMVYKYDRNEDKGTAAGTALTGLNTAFLAPTVLPIYQANNLYINPTRQSPKIVTNSFVIPRDSLVYGHSLTATWNATDSITVKNIAAFRYTRVFGVSAIDGVSGLNFNGLRNLFTASQSTTITKQWSDELQANYTSENLQVTVGAMAFHAKDVSGGPEGMMNTFSGTFARGLPASGLLPLGNEGRYFNKATSLAAYAQIEYKFNDQFELVAGGRLTKDKKTSRFRWDSVVNGVIVPRPTIVPPVYKDTRPNYLVGLNWTPAEDMLIYGKYSTSFVSGGSVAAIEFKPEIAKAWELGLKADFLDRRLRTNLALFYVDYKGFQQPSSTTSVEAIAFLTATYGALGTSLASALSTFVQQAHDVRAKGFELEVTAAPTQGLTLGGSLSYTKSEFLNINPTFLAAQGGIYHSFTRPAWTASFYGAYETQPLFNESTLQFRIDGLYRSVLRLTAIPERQMNVFGVTRSELTSPAHWKFNGRVALTNIEVGGAKAEFSIWGRNLTDKRYATSTLYLASARAANYDDGRTWGVELGFEF